MAVLQSDSIAFVHARLDELRRFLRLTVSQADGMELLSEVFGESSLGVLPEFRHRVGSRTQYEDDRSRGRKLRT